MRNSSSFNILAVVLILIGIVFMLDNYSIVTSILIFWPILPLIIGIGFTLLFFRSKRKDLILLGMGVFITSNSTFFFYLNFTGWSLLAVLWPAFIAIVGLTFAACSFFSKNRVLIYLAVFLIALGIAFILVFAVSTTLWPLTLILTGLSFILINIFEKKIIRGGSYAKRR
jgi:hypothetical protein